MINLNDLENNSPANPVHVWPQQDPFPHESTPECPCGPQLKHIDWPEGKWWGMVHPALNKDLYDIDEGTN